MLISKCTNLNLLPILIRRKIFYFRLFSAEGTGFVFLYRENFEVGIKGVIGEKPPYERLPFF